MQKFPKNLFIFLLINIPIEPINIEEIDNIKSIIFQFKVSPPIRLKVYNKTIPKIDIKEVVAIKRPIGIGKDSNKSGNDI